MTDKEDLADEPQVAAPSDQGVLDPEDESHTVMAPEGVESEELPGRRVRPPSKPASSASRKRAATALEGIGFSQSAAKAVARAVEDPGALVGQLKVPAELGVHGGTIKYVAVRVRNAAVLPLPTNPRVAGEVNYAAGGPGGAGGIEPLTVAGLPENQTGVSIRATSPTTLSKDMEAAANYVRSSNRLRESVASQGVLLPVTLVPTLFTFGDGSEPRSALCTVDGSSRLTACMDVWGLTPQEVLFDLSTDSKMDERINAVETLLERDDRDLTEEDRAKLRTRSIPAQLIVGWESEDGTLSFPDIMDAYLGLLHVEPPTPWGEAANQDTRAEVVLDELQRIKRLTEERRRYLAGLLTPEEAEGLGFDPTLDGRAAALFYEFDRRRNTNAINRALRRIGMKSPQREDRLEVATELAMRPYRRRLGSMNRRNPRMALPAAMSALKPDGKAWKYSNDGADQLLEAALEEVRAGGPGPKSRELTARGAFWLTRYSALQKSSRTDPRLANEVVTQLMSNEHGLRCLHRAVVDGRLGQVPRQVREDGSLRVNAAGQHQDQTDRWLRETFPKAVGPEPDPDPATQDPEVEPDPMDVLNSRFYSLRELAESVKARVDNLREVQENGSPLVEQVGIPKDTADEIGQNLHEAYMRVHYLGETWQRTSDIDAG